MKKKLLTITTGLLLLATALQANEILVVHPAGAAAQEFYLEEIRHISFTENEMVVTPRNATAVFFVLEDLFFDFGPLTHINVPRADNIDLSVYITPEGEVMISSEVQVLSLMVFDINGRQLMTSNSDQLNVSALSAGIYILSIETTQGRVVKRFIKQH